LKKINLTNKLTILATFILFTLTPSYALGSKIIIVPRNAPKKYTVDYVQQLMPLYKKVSKEPVVCIALDMLQGTTGEFSREAILGNNLSLKPVKIEFKDLGAINANYKDFDALGWKKGKDLYIFINPRHQDAPPGALAALLSHEALHQDEYNSLAEETYAWTMEADVWTEILKLYPESDEKMHPLVNREDTLRTLFIKGGYTNRYIKKTVMSNEGYKNLPSTSPGFDDL
jgi:hypothetical protein